MARPAAALILVCSFGTLSAATTATDTVGTAYTSSSEVLMLGIAGANQAVLEVGDIMDQTEAGARAEARATWAVSDGGYLRYTAHGFTYSFKVMVESQTVGYVDGSIALRTLWFVEGGSPRITLGFADDPWHAIRRTPFTWIKDISGTDTWTGTTYHDGVMLQYFTTEQDLGVSSIEVVCTMIAQD